MSTTHHTPHPFGAPVTAAQFNGRLGQLDAAISLVMAAMGGASSTMDAQALAGATIVSLVNATGFEIGDYVVVGAPGTGLLEGHTVTSINVASNNLVFAEPLENTQPIGTVVSRSPAEIVAARGPMAGTLPQRLEWLSLGAVTVAEHGAVGDGVTDDSSAIQAAIDVAGSSAWVVFGDRAVYAIGAGLVIPSGAHLDLRGSTIQRKAGTIAGVADAAMLKATGGTGIVIRDGVIDGNKAANSLDAATVAHRFGGVEFDTVTDSRLENLEVKGVCTVEGATAGEGSAGIYLLNCESVVVSRIRAHDNDRTGVLLWTSSRCQLLDLQLHDNLGSGISSFTSPDCVYRNIQARDNGSAGSYSGVSVNGLRCIVSDILSEGAGHSGLNIGHPTQAVDDTVVMNVIARNNGVNGINIQGGQRVHVTNAVCHNNGENGLRISNSAGMARIRGVTAYENGEQGIRLDSGFFTLVEGCRANNNGFHGIVATAAATHGQMLGNHCMNNGQDASVPTIGGITIEGASNWQVQGNRCNDTAASSKTQAYGIWLNGASSACLVINNWTHNNKTTNLQASGTGHTVLDNH